MSIIDSAVDAAADTTPRCACGCGTLLNGDDGPSPWFAAEACQERWIRTINRIEPPPRQAASRGSITPERAYPAAPQVYPDCADIFGAAYRVGCPGCRQRVIARVHRVGDHLRHHCTSCSAPLPGAAYAASVDLQPDRPGTVLFELCDAHVRVRRRTSADYLTQFANLADIIWDDMARQLERFTRAWHRRRLTRGDD